jgi:hypothetical protein
MAHRCAVTLNAIDISNIFIGFAWLCSISADMGGGGGGGGGRRGEHGGGAPIESTTLHTDVLAPVPASGGRVGGGRSSSEGGMGGGRAGVSRSDAGGSEVAGVECKAWDATSLRFRGAVAALELRLASYCAERLNGQVLLALVA